MTHPWTRVLVCGGRTYSDRRRVTLTIRKLIRRGAEVLIHGGANGADMLAVTAWQKCRPVTDPGSIIWFPAEWERLGLAAGPIRNQRMIDEGKPDVVIAFPGGRGTADMTARAAAAGIPVVRIGERT